MARPVRVDVEGGWYHVTARGIERRAIFVDTRDHEHFLELLATMGERSIRRWAWPFSGRNYGAERLKAAHQTPE